MTEKKTLDHLRNTEVFETYWRLASERHAIFERRLRGEPPPYTEDPILSKHKFTNAFRAADRVSQYLIRHVIYTPEASMEDEEVAFRVLLFKLFNSIGAWEALKEALLDVPSWRTFDAQAYAVILGGAKARGVKIWNAAYVQNQQYRVADFATKHERYLALLNYMIEDGVTGKLKAARSYREAYRVLRTYPIHGEFIAMQHLTDLNYSPVLNFDENDFIVAGPGALDGMQKCFGIRPDQELASEIINRCVKHQEGMFSDLNLEPVTLFGRRLTAIDCQNLFCETDKYARVAHPQYNLQRSEIKQQFKSQGPLMPPFFPPKWGVQVSCLKIS